MAVTQTDLEALITSANTAIDAGNYALARKEVVKAEIMLKALPDYGIGGRFVRFRQDVRDLLSLIGALEKANSTDSTKNQRVFTKFYRG